MKKLKTDIFQEKLKKLPSTSGVYLMKDDKDGIIYVGKAKNIKARLSSYLGGKDSRYQVKFLMRNVADIEVMVTDTEKEALILEDILIKKHRPRYNIHLKDDKTYLSLRVNTKHPFPRVEVVRKREKDSALYFGPYSSAQALRDTLSLLQRVFMIRTCTESYFSNRARPCLNYQIKRCLGPCCDLVSKEEYGDVMSEVILFLEGKNKELIKRFKKRMKKTSDQMNFEEAARFRDCIFNIEKTLEKQHVFTSQGVERDVVGFYFHDRKVAIYSLFIRGGKVGGGKSFIFEDRGVPESELLSSFLRRYYSSGRYIAKELLIPLEIDDWEVIEEWLSDMKGKKVRLYNPKMGEKRRLVDLAMKNAKSSLMAELKDERSDEELLSRIKEQFNLNHLPTRIECFDISNIQGEQAVGSLVTFVAGKADKNLYRHFKIKTVQGPDDFSMMYEVIHRRLKRGLEAGDLPNLILIDGGKGQLSMAKKALEENGLTDAVDLLAIAKEKVLKVKGIEEKKEERVYMPGRKNPVKLKDKGEILYLFQRIRDEAHRFAITYHRKLRGKAALISPLDGIKGVGHSKKTSLLNHFGSLKKVRSASIEELQEVPGISEKLAVEINRGLRA
ncbi:MAG: excinuclease ABC subunit UvrC [Proteobacteria bacterium]|nr:excinuclease ABC subunit UvrC [Pseudomonadota bacterium]